MVEGTTNCVVSFATSTVLGAVKDKDTSGKRSESTLPAKSARVMIANMIAFRGQRTTDLLSTLKDNTTSTISQGTLQKYSRYIFQIFPYPSLYILAPCLSRGEMRYLHLRPTIDLPTTTYSIIHFFLYYILRLDTVFSDIFEIL